MSEVTNAESQKITSLTLDAVLQKLSEKVTGYNAKLLLNHAIYQSGVSGDLATPLDAESAKSVCMALIDKGGPSFQVGKALYQQILRILDYLS